MRVPTYKIQVGCVLCMLFCLFTSCHKEFPDKPYVPLGGDFGNYFAAPGKGSVYIYVDTSGTVYDTAIVTRKMNKIYSGLSYINEGYVIEYTCSATLDFRTDIVATTNGSYFDILYKAGKGIQVFRDTTGKYKPTRDVGFLDSIVVNGIVFKDILFAKDKYQYHTQIWCAKDIGIIQKRIKTIYGDSTFSIVNFELK